MNSIFTFIIPEPFPKFEMVIETTQFWEKIMNLAKVKKQFDGSKVTGLDVVVETAGRLQKTDGLWVQLYR